MSLTATWICPWRSDRHLIQVACYVEVLSRALYDLHVFNHAMSRALKGCEIVMRALGVGSKAALSADMFKRFPVPAQLSESMQPNKREA
jgi:hypothetical protein